MNKNNKNSLKVKMNNLTNLNDRLIIAFFWTMIIANCIAVGMYGLFWIRSLITGIQPAISYTTFFIDYETLLLITTTVFCGIAFVYELTRGKLNG